MTRTLLRLALLLAFNLPPSTVYAHQLDEYVQATLVDIDPAAIRLRINLTPGVEVSDKVLDVLDPDGDGAVTEKESAAYAGMLKGDLAERLDGRNIELSVTASSVPGPSELRAGWGIIQMEVSMAPSALTAGVHKLTFQNRHFRSIGVYSFNAAHPRSDSIQIIEQKRNDDQTTGEIEFAFDPPANQPKTPMVALLALLAIATMVAVWWLAGSRRRST